MADTKILIEVGAKNTTQRTFDQVQKSMKQTQVATGAANRSFRQMRGMMGQMGHQVQDVAVQMQMGTNAMIVLGQQGGQIAALFGPYGAIFGAFIAIGAALGTSLAPAIFKTRDALKELENAQSALNAVMANTKIGEATVEYQDLLDVSSALAQMQLDFSLFKMSEAVDANKEALIEALGGSYSVLSDISEMQNNIAQGSSAYAKQQREFMSEVQMQAQLSLTQKFGKAGGELHDVLSNLYNAKTSADVSDTIQALMGIEQTTEGFGKAKLAATKYALGLFDLLRQQEKLDKGLKPAGDEKEAEKEAEIFGKREDLAKDFVDKKIFNALNEKDQLEKIMLDQMGRLNEIEREGLVKDPKRILAARLQINAEYLSGLSDLAEKEKNIRDKAAADAVRAEQAKWQAQKQTFDVGESVFGKLADLAAEGSKAQKAAFLAQKAFAVASIIADTERAAAAAGAYDAATMGMAGWFSSQAGIRAMGYASAGVVAGTTLASFEGGGITFDGIRAGGVDGKGGRMAVVHPNEKITDLEKEGGSQPVSVNINLSAIDTQTGAEFLMKNRAIITNAVTKAMNNKARRGLM